MWSIGVILYKLLSGDLPFTGQDYDEIFSKIRRGTVSFDQFQNISSEGKDLIKSLLVVDTYIRFSVDEAISHPWFKKNEVKEVFNKISCDILYDDLVQRLR